MKKLIIVFTALTVLLVVSGAVGAQNTPVAPLPMLEDGRPNPIRTVLAIIADETGLEQQAILRQFAAGTPLVDIIKDNNGDVQSVIDESISQITVQVNEAVANGTMTQQRGDRVLANLPDVITEAINGERFPMRPSRGGVRGTSQRILIQATADATSLRPLEILRQLHGGNTLATIIGQNGGDVKSVISAAVTQATADINAAVLHGRMGQEQADRLLADLEQTYTAAVNGEFQSRAQQAVVSLAVLRLAAEKTDLTVREITQEIRSGKSLAEVLTANNVDVDTFIGTVVEIAKTRLDQAITNGRLTQADADARLAEFEHRLTERIYQAGGVHILPEATSAA